VNAEQGTLIREAIGQILGIPCSSIGDQDDLIRLGLDSMAVMRLVGRWHAAGIAVSYADLVATPTTAAWVDVLARADRVESPPVLKQARAARAPLDEPFRLAPMQQAYWIGRSSNSGLGGVNAHYYVELEGRGVDPARLRGAIDRLLARHAMLRASFLPDGLQRIRAPKPWNGLMVRDLRDAPPEQIDPQLAQLRDHHRNLQMAVEAGEVFGAALTLLPQCRTRLHLNIDMLVADATSFRIILNELALLYEDPDCALPEISNDFADYLELELHQRESSRRSAASYWAEHRAGLSGPAALPLAIDPASALARRSASRSEMLDEGFLDALRRMAQDHGLTLPAVLATAFAEVVAQWSAERRFLLNLPVFDRQPLLPDVDRMVGDFTNLCLVDVDLDSSADFASNAREIQRRLHAAAANVAYSGVDVLRDLSRDRGSPALAPIVFTSAISLGDLYSDHLRETLGKPVWISSQTPQVWLDCQVTDRDGGLHVNWDFVDGLFQPGVIDAMFEAYGRILGQLADDAKVWAEPVASLLPSRQAALRAQRNETDAPLPQGSLHDGFFEAVKASPDAPALIGEDDGVLSYAELGRRVEDARRVLTTHGVERGELVAISLPPGAEQVAACLGLLSLGAAYLPVGLDQPPARRERIWRLSGITKAIMPTAEPETACSDSEVQLIALDAAGACKGPTPALEPVDPEALAYVIYTSGSTGEPKGVEITHRAALNTIADINRRLTLGKRDRVLAVSAADFDLSVWDVFGALAAGATLVSVPAHARRDPDHWSGLVQRHGVTVWNSVPALLDMLLSVARPGALTSLRAALVSGDWIPLDLPARLRAATPDCRFLAMGGATEASIWSNLYEVDKIDCDWRSIPYGFPLANQRFRVVDNQGRDRPDWVAGELWIGGAGVARGYRGDSERTRERFVRHDGDVWYRTGDLGRYWPDGTLEFLGRADHQVKLRGNRIELGEIESALEQHDAIDRAVAAVVSDRIGVAVATADRSLERDDVVAYLEALLPSAMTPSVVVIVADLPLTPNGKVDRQAATALLSVAAAATEDCASPLESATEESVAAVWSEVLGKVVSSRTATFFEYGGDSLLATRIVSRIHARMGVALALREFLQSPNVAGIARLIDARAAHGPLLEEGEI
jgi:yersiniabactin nonribosomal peptide synthetase